MTNKPKVSIITPLFNRVELIKETLDSVRQQIYENWEAIVVDDGSTDGSYEYVEKVALEEPRIKLYRRERTPKGASTCRNIGIEKSKSEFIIFLDSDDLLASHCLEQRVNAIQKNTECDFIVFPILTFKNNIIEKKQLFTRIFYQDYLTSFLLQSHWLITNPIWRKDALVRLHGFDENLLCLQDGDLHRRALIEGMHFKVFDQKKYVDAFLRANPSNDRISNTISYEMLSSKKYAHEKMFLLLAEKDMINPIRRNIIAAHFLNIGWKFCMIGESEKGFNTWKFASEKKLVNSITYHAGRLFIRIRCSRLVRKSNLIAGGITRIFQIFLPKFLLWPK